MSPERSSWRLAAALLGLFGLLVEAVGLAFGHLEKDLTTAPALAMMISGGVLIALGVACNLSFFVRMVRSRRFWIGVNVAVALLLAGAILTIINVASHRHFYARIDTTCNREFSLSEKTISNNSSRGSYI